MDAANEKESLIALPLQERAVAVALKQIFDSIKQLEEEQARENQKIHHAFIARFKEIEQKGSKVIKGSPIPAQLLQNTENFFTECERKDAVGLAAGNKGIPAYWLTAILNFYQDGLSLQEKEIAAAITDISTNVTVNSLEFTFEISASEWLKAGSITKRFILEEGIVTKCEGDNAKWLKPKPEGLLANLLSEITEPTGLNAAYGLASDLINEIVPYSIEYFLGAIETVDEEDLAEEDEGEGDEDDEDEQDEVPSKKVKE